MKIKNCMTNELKDSGLSDLYPPKKLEFLSCPVRDLTVGGRVRRERLLRKMTIEEMSNCLSCSPTYLGAIERGKRPVSRNFMKKLHDILGISYDFLLDGNTISGTAIAQYVQEGVIYSTHHNLNVLLNVCNEEELDSCYQLVHTYLPQIRNPEKFKGTDFPSANLCH